MRAWAADRRQLAITVFGSVLFLAWSMLVLHNARLQKGEVLGDWVMNYSQGFVRRGLIGSLLGLVSDATQLDLTKWVPALQIALYGCFLFFWLRVLAGRRKPFWYLLLVFSPATLLFSYFGSAEVGRKEVLHFALLAVMVWALSTRRLNVGMAVLLTLMSILATLSHELVVFYTPYYLMAAAVAPLAQRRLAWITAVAMAAASAGAALCIFWWAHPLNGQVMCGSLMDAGYSGSICKGIILWPMQGGLANVEGTLKVIQYFNYFALYPLALLLAVAPVLLWLRRYGHGVIRKQMAWFAVAALASLPAFILAMDWGRFIQIHLVSAMIVLSLQLRRHAEPGRGQGLGHAASAAEPLIRWPHPALGCAAAMACLSLAMFWNMPTCCVSDLGTGLLGKLDDATGYLVRMTGR